MKSLKLPSFIDSTTSYVDSTLQLASWGLYSNENVVSDLLRSSEMEVISQENCLKAFPPPLITELVICTKNSHCSGDSGSMLVDKHEHGELVAVGIASFGFNSCSEEVIRPSVFMKITSYLEFIEANSDLIIS